MKKLLVSVLTPLVLSISVFGSTIGNGYNIDDKMPPLPEETYENTWFKLWKKDKKRGVVIFHDLNKDKDYDFAASYIRCGKDSLRIKFPYGIFDRKGIYGKPGVLYLDPDMNNHVNKVIDNIGDRNVSDDAPNCPKE